MDDRINQIRARKKIDDRIRSHKHQVTQVVRRSVHRIELQIPATDAQVIGMYRYVKTTGEGARSAQAKR